MTDQAPRGALADVKLGFKVTMALLLIVSGCAVNVVVAKLTSIPNDLLKVGGILATTLPLSLWAAITAYVFLATSWSGLAQALLSMAVLATSTLLANALGLERKVSLGTAWDHPGGIFQKVSRLVVEYFAQYGWASFVSALIVGAFLGFAAWRLLDSPPPPRR